MVLIDMPMPDRCLDCPFFKKHSDCGQCKGTKKGKWIEPEDYNKRQDWCPIKEAVESPYSSDSISKRKAIDIIMDQPPELHYPSWYAEQIRALPTVDAVPVASIEDEIRFLMTLGNPFSTTMSLQLSAMLNRWKEREGNEGI